MDDSDVWAALIAEAITRAGLGARACQVNWFPTPWYADYEHIDVRPHRCPQCAPGECPRYFVTTHMLLTVRHEALVQRIAVWLLHLHSGPPDDDSARAVVAPTGAAGRAPCATSDRRAAVVPTLPAWAA